MSDLQPNQQSQTSSKAESAESIAQQPPAGGARGAESTGGIAGGGRWSVFATAEGPVIVVTIEKGWRVKRRLPKEHGGQALDKPALRARFAKAAAPNIKASEIAKRRSESTDPARVDPRLTFRDVGELWTSGDLARRWPDYVKEKKTSKNDASRLGVLYKVIGNVPIADFTLAHAEKAMSKLPEACRTSGARRHYAQTIKRVLGLAKYPLGLPAIELPKGFLPKLGGKKADQWLRPSEDRQLLGCPDVPLMRRLLWGFLCREGMRVASEALLLRWRDVDLAVGSITLTENKTDDPRAWSADPGVVRARAAYYELLGRPDKNSRIFVDERGCSIEGLQHATIFRADLATAKVDRPELFERSKNRLPIRAHDLRATFVTISLANGKSEAWIADRTGNTTSEMINRYRRAARTANELNLGELTPLDHAIPELAPPPGAPEDLSRGSSSGPVPAPGRGMRRFAREHVVPLRPSHRALTQRTANPRARIPRFWILLLGFESLRRNRFGAGFRVGVIAPSSSRLCRGRRGIHDVDAREPGDPGVTPRAEADRDQRRAVGEEARVIDLIRGDRIVERV